MNSKRSVPITVLILLTTFPGTGQAGSPRGPDLDWDQLDDLPIGAGGETVSSDANAGAISFLYGGSDGLAEPGGYTNFVSQETIDIDEESDPSDYFGTAMAWGDLDGDCIDDLVIGIGNETVNGNATAGLVQVIYGSSTGPSTTDELWSRHTTGILEDPNAGDRFGTAVAVGDFDDDGYDDLVVGVPNDDDTASNAGSIHVIYGSSSGLTATDDAWFNQASANVEGVADANDLFGSSLAAGDFNCDGYDDVAIGVTGENTNEGAVQIIYGGSGGLSATAGPGDDIFQQGDTNIQDSKSSGDKFGQVLAVGNFDDNSSGGVGCQDLAVGVPMEDGTVSDHGLVHVFYGTSASGIQFTSPNDDLWHQDVGTIQDTAEELDFFGYALVVGEMDNDAYDDLAIGVPQEEIESASQGAVHIIRGGSGGLVDTSNVLWTQETTGVGGTNAVGDQFGAYLGFGLRFDWNNAIGGLVVGAPYEDHTSVSAPGLSYVIYLDDASTPTINYTEIWDQADIADTNEASDQFGYAFVPTRDVEFRCPTFW